MAASKDNKPARVGVVKLASCDGCQLGFLDLGPALLDIGVKFQIVEFAEASSNRSPDGPFDILFVEGSISTDEHKRHIQHMRDRTDLLVTIGACATSGGIQALRAWAGNDGGIDSFIDAVYATPEYVELAGFGDEITECREYDQLPPAAREYIAFVSDFVGVPIALVGVGPGREQVVWSPVT